MRKFLILAGVLMAVSLTGYAEEPIVANADEQLEAIQDKATSPKKPRLKFKGKGPTCLCADGLSEKDILQQQLNKQTQQSKI